VKAGNVDFDDTYIDIITSASIDVTRGAPSAQQKKYLEKIQKMMNGKVTLKDEEFYLRPGNQAMLEFSLVAEGVRKIALLWQLISNGTLESGSVLFWDEPEANINPKNIPAIVDLLLDLQKNGVQIFIATHDYFLAKYIDSRKNKQHSIEYHALYKAENGKIEHESEVDFALLENNSIIKQSIELYKEEVKKVML
jgi:wobble nucleotide-excising tRNase